MVGIVNHKSKIINGEACSGYYIELERGEVVEGVFVVGDTEHEPGVGEGDCRG